MNKFFTTLDMRMLDNIDLSSTSIAPIVLQ